MSEFTVDQYTSLKLEERGQYGFSLMEGWIGREGDFKPSFCKREVGKKGEKVEKTMPVNVKIGARENVIMLAHWLLSELGEQQKHEPEQPPVDDSDVPF